MGLWSRGGGALQEKVYKTLYIALLYLLFIHQNIPNNPNARQQIGKPHFTPLLPTEPKHHQLQRKDLHTQPSSPTYANRKTDTFPITPTTLCIQLSSAILTTLPQINPSYLTLPISPTTPYPPTL